MGGWSRAGRTAVLVIALLMTAAGAACGAGPAPDGLASSAPSAGPDITGIVWQASSGPSDTGSLYVVGLQGGAGSYDTASVAITPDTAWRLSDGSASPPSLYSKLVGRRVAVTFTGPVAESYPVQAAAGSVQVLEGLDVNMHVTPTGVPQVHGMAVEMARDDVGDVVGLRVRQPASAANLTEVPVAAATSWLLATPTELKPANGVPLIGNGLGPTVDVRVERGVAVWIAVFLPR
jgi:hypothetical protein